MPKVKRIIFLFVFLYLTGLVLLSLSVTAVVGDDMKDVKEGEDVVLECRFGSHLV